MRAPSYRNPDASADYLHQLGVRFSASVPITSAMVADPSQGGFMTLGGAAEASPSSMPAAVGVAPGGKQHATNVHVGMWLLGAGVFIAGWHLSGFRMAFDVGMGR